MHLRSVRLLQVTANDVPSSPILITLMMEAIRSSETLVLIRATRRHIPKDGILHYRFLNDELQAINCSIGVQRPVHEMILLF
jgi:hypothetical protein